MWFSRKNQTATNTDVQAHCQQLLAELSTNGVELSMQELLQYQNKSRLIDLAAKRNIQGKQAGNYLSRSKGRGMEFDEVRHYQTGDDVRAIDWRVTARTGKTHTKLFREEIERPVLIATDLSNAMQFGSQLLYKSVQAAHLASLVAWHAKNRGDRLGGLVFRDEKHIELKPRSRKAGVLHYLHALTTLNNQVAAQGDSSANSNERNTDKANLNEINAVNEKTNDELGTDNSSVNPSVNSSVKDKPVENHFESHCARLRHMAKPGSLVYLITDGYALLGEQSNPHALKHLSQISQHCELVVCLINDPLELSLPTSHLKLAVTFTDGSKRQQVTLGDNSTAQSYKAQAEQLTQQLNEKFQSAGARIIRFSAGNSLEQQIKDNGGTL